MSALFTDLSNYKRFQTREVLVGSVGIGGNNPIRIQSMTTTDTMDTQATVEQSIRMIEAGCELVRITAPSRKEAENLANIKSELKARGYHTPLVADIHFTPNAAEIAARIVEKVRVNPGNYVDKKKFDLIEYSDAEYQEEIERIHEKFSPLVKICKENGTAMRIGTNHGSLSDRIMSRYGDTPLGMVESALEFIRICEYWDYQDIIVSMKASNPQVMIQAYRLLVDQFKETGRNYPLHLGVTEAGEAEDGRVKSAMGIGALLEDGIGDTVRVSLTEEPEIELPVARALVDRYQNRSGHASIPEFSTIGGRDLLSHHPHETTAIDIIGADQVPVVIAECIKPSISKSDLNSFGFEYSEELDKWNVRDMAADFLYVGDQPIPFELPGIAKQLIDAPKWNSEIQNSFPVFSSISAFTSAQQISSICNIIQLEVSEIAGLCQQLKPSDKVVLLLSSNKEHKMASFRNAITQIEAQQYPFPVIFHHNYQNISQEDMMLYPSTDIGAVLIEGMGNGIFLKHEELNPSELLNIQYTILQSARRRISKTEYISCPSCGRTLFDLPETTAMIRAQTSHLKGVKIGIMGCIVNGPGEMADADYGYVGSGKGKITLYRGQEVVKKGIGSEYALDELIELIKSDGKWVEA